MKKRPASRFRRKAGPTARLETGVQYTVRNVPRMVDAALRRKAAEERKSLNEVLRQALMKEAGSASQERRTYDDLDHLAGTWVEDPEFDAAIAAQDVVDESLWK
jgi:plasmid stability protein